MMRINLANLATDSRSVLFSHSKISNEQVEVLLPGKQDRFRTARDFPDSMVSLRGLAEQSVFPRPGRFRQSLRGESTVSSVVCSDVDAS